jgi:hypothetical protein
MRFGEGCISDCDCARRLYCLQWGLPPPTHTPTHAHCFLFVFLATTSILAAVLIAAKSPLPPPIPPALLGTSSQFGTQFY